MKRNLLLVSTALACLLVPAAHAATFLQYDSTSSDLITFNGTTISGTAIPVNLSYLLPEPGAPTTANLTFSASAVAGTAGDLGGFFFGQSFNNISFSLISGATDILSGTAATGSLSGTDAGLELSAQAPGDTITFASVLYGPMSNLSFQIGIGPPSTDLSDAGGNLSAFTATATPGAFVGTAAATPEPSSLALLGTGLVGLVGIARRKLAA